ncbi:MAG: hypothetical protein HYV19_00325 [Gemmatimonadetes bacterium]|nr:hypothetical protein [Gemmatimonadota bacterium]
MSDRRSAADHFEHLARVLDAARDKVNDDIESAVELLDSVDAVVDRISQRLRLEGRPVDGRTEAAAERVRRSHADLLHMLEARSAALRDESAELQAVSDAISRYGGLSVGHARLVDRLC